jgi:bifunctional non-homologous end joining protein LigD
MSSITLDGHEVKLSSQDKILFPKSKITKGDLVSYYQRIAPYMIPLIYNHPLTLRRFPNGITHEGFYQKEVSAYFPKWIKRKEIKRRSVDEFVTYAIGNDTATLVYLANQGTLVFHIWLSTAQKITHPDRMIFDLDPSNNRSWPQIKKTAKQIKKKLEAYGLTPFLMTSGSKGLHITTPLTQTATFDKVRAFTKKIAEELVEENPKTLTVEIRKEKRGTKIFIDTLRNQWAQLGVAPYSARAKEGAPIATPIEWSELSNSKLNPQAYTIKNIFRRLSRKKNPWKDFYKKAHALPE